MAQNLSNLRRVFYGIESTEGTRVAGSATTAVLPISLSIKRDTAFNERKFMGQMGKYTGNIGEYPDTSLSMSFELRSQGSSHVSGTVSGITDLDELYKTVFGTRTLDTAVDQNTSAGSTSTVINVASTTGYTVGNAVAVATGAGASTFYIGWIASIQAATSLTLTKALTDTSGAAYSPASGCAVRPSLTYACANTGHQSLTFDVYDAANASGGSAQFMSLLGCKGSAKFDFPGPGQIPTVSFDFHAINWQTATNGTVPAQTIGDSVTPTVDLASMFKLDATRTDTRSLSIDMGQSLGRKKSRNSTYGTFAQVVTDRDCHGSISLYNGDYTQYSAWVAGTSAEIAHQMGNTLGGIVAMRAPNAQRKTVSDGSDGTMVTDDIDFQCGITSGADEIYLAIL